MIRTLVAAFVLLAWSVPGLAATRHEASVRLLPEERRIEASDRIWLEASGEVVLRLSPDLGVAAVRVDGAAADWRREGAAIVVPVGAAGRHRIEIAYAGMLESDEPLVSAQGSFLPAGSGWLPELAEEDGATWRLAAEIALPQRLVATGELISEAETDGRYRAEFEVATGEPPSLFAGPYEIAERRVDGLLLRTWFTAGTAHLAEDYLADSRRLIAHFAERIGPFPFNAFHVVAAPLPVGLGFPGLTYIDARILPLPFLRGQSLPHEILHNWWGNGVRTDYRRGNWAEGLTTYMADHDLQEPERRRAMRFDWLRDYASLPAGRDAPVRGFTFKAHDAAQIVGYNKVAFIFHMLRGEVGEAAFERAIRAFWRDHWGRSAAWEDLRAAFEAESGRGLGGFFEQWLERPGAPALHLAAASAEPGAVTLTIRQDRPYYDLAVPVAVTTASGVLHATVRLTDAEATARLALPDEPVAVTVDPDYDLFRRLAPGEAPPILRDVTLAEAAVVVIAAAGEAADTARRLAARMMDGEVAFSESVEAGRPRLVIGTEDLVGPLLRGPVPAAMSGRGTARVWAERDADGAPTVVVMARDAAALAELLRPLPHYGRQGWLVFEGRKAVAKGAWPADGNALRRRLN